VLKAPDASRGIDPAELGWALETANVHALLAVLVQLTGEDRWWEESYRPARIPRCER
jgi:hypothetical protein